MTAMQNEQTPAAGPLTAESVKLLKKGDWLRALKPCYGPDARIEPGDIVPFESTEHGLIGVAGDFWRPSAFTFLGRPDQDGWIAHDGEVKGPVDGSGIMCDFIMSDGREYLAQKHPRFWHLVSKWRPHVPSPASSSSVVQGDAGGVERERIAKCIIGPRFPVPSTSKFSLSELRDVRWEGSRSEDKADALSAADAIIALRPQPSGETRRISVDDLAQEIRCVDGSHSLGAGALAEALMPFLTRPAPVASSDQPEQGGGMGDQLFVKVQQIVDDALNSAIPEPWEVSSHAATRIVDLIRAEPAEARVRELGAMLDDVSDQVSRWIGAHDEQEARATAAEARLAKAREALEEARTELGTYEQERSGETYNNPKLNQVLAALQQAGEVG